MINLNNENKFKGKMLRENHRLFSSLMVAGSMREIWFSNLMDAGSMRREVECQETVGVLQ